MGFFGKIPAERDFVRINAGSFLQAGLDHWFQEGAEHLPATGLPEEPACFILSAAVGGRPFVGVLAPGEDALGRAFPVVIFAALDAQWMRENFPLVSVQFTGFWEAGARLAVAARRLGAAQLAGEIDTLTSGFRPAGQALDALLDRSRCSHLRAAAGGPPEAAAYALTTLVAACCQSKAVDSSERALVLDCPAPTDELRAFWLELVRRHLRAQMPSFLWTRANGRLLVALGPAPSRLLAYLADPKHENSRLWPLRTIDQSALQNAFEKLSSGQTQTLAAMDASLADVLQAF